MLNHIRLYSALFIVLFTQGVFAKPSRINSHRSVALAKRTTGAQCSDFCPTYTIACQDVCRHFSAKSVSHNCIKPQNQALSVQCHCDSNDLSAKVLEGLAAYFEYRGLKTVYTTTTEYTATDLATATQFLTKSIGKTSTVTETNTDAVSTTLTTKETDRTPATVTVTTTGATETETVTETHTSTQLERRHSSWLTTIFDDHHFCDGFGQQCFSACGLGGYSLLQSQCGLSGNAFAARCVCNFSNRDMTDTAMCAVLGGEPDSSKTVTSKVTVSTRLVKVTTQTVSETKSADVTTTVTKDGKHATVTETATVTTRPADDSTVTTTYTSTPTAYTTVSTTTTVSASFPTITGKVKVLNSTDSTLLGYLTQSTPDFNHFGVNSSFENAITVLLEATSDQPNRINFQALTSYADQWPFMGGIMFVGADTDDLSSGSSNFVYIQGVAQTPPGSVALNVSNSYTSSTHKNSESAIWTLDESDRSLSVLWVNTDLSVQDTTLAWDMAGNAVIATGDYDAFSTNFDKGSDVPIDLIFVPNP